MNPLLSLLSRLVCYQSSRRLKRRIGYVSESFGLNRYWQGDRSDGALYIAPPTYIVSLSYAGADQLIRKRIWYESPTEVTFLLRWEDFSTLAKAIHRYRVDHGVKERVP